MNVRVCACAYAHVYVCVCVCVGEFYIQDMGVCIHMHTYTTRAGLHKPVCMYVHV